MPFRDHFSQHAKEYAQNRPVYPAAMFAFLAALARSRELAWDCGTGNGQAALALAQEFEHVIATDASQAQIENAFLHEKIEYRVEPSEETSLSDGSVDLTTVGTAVHWFDFDPFYAEVRRVSKPGAILAVWTYFFPIIEPAVDRWIDKFYWETLQGYWPERIRYLEQRYQTLPFPFEEIQPPAFEMQAEWNVDHLIGFIGSWSGTKRLIEAQGEAAFQGQVEELERLWGQKTQPKEIRWPLHFRIGRVA